MMKRLIYAILILMITCPALSGQSVQSRQNRKAALEKEIAAINARLRDNAKSSSKALSDLDLVRRKVKVQQALLDESDAILKSLRDSISRCNREIAFLDSRMDTLTHYYEKLVRNAYKNRDNRLWLLYLVSSEDLGQAYRRFAYMKNLSSKMSAQAVSIRETSAQLSARKEELVVMKNEAETLKRERAWTVSELRAAESEAGDLVAKLGRDRKTYQQQLEKKNREMEQLNREIAEMIRKATSGSSKTASKKTGKTTSTAIDTKLNARFAANKGHLPWPAEGTVVESFGRNEHPVYKNLTMPFNNGVTISVPQGTAARAVFDGEVTQIVVMRGYNQCVLVRHGEYFTFYCHLGSVCVRSGEKVKTGQILGTVDNVGGESRLHFQLWKGRNPQNPELWLK